MLRPDNNLQVCVRGLDVHVTLDPIGQKKAILAVALAVAVPASAVLLGFSLRALTYKNKEAIQSYSPDMCMAEEQR